MMTKLEPFILQWWVIVWIPERILRRLLCHSFAELRRLHCCGIKVSKTAIENCKAPIFLENTVGHHRSVLLVLLSRTYALKTLTRYLRMKALIMFETTFSNTKFHSYINKLQLSIKTITITGIHTHKHISHIIYI